MIDLLWNACKMFTVPNFSFKLRLECGLCDEEEVWDDSLARERLKDLIKAGWTVNEFGRVLCPSCRKTRRRHASRRRV
jgi:hypothetical protein